MTCDRITVAQADEKMLQEQTKTRTGWLVGHSDSWAIVMNRCWDMQSSVIDVEGCYRKVFMRVGNVSRSRRVNIPEFVFTKMDTSSEPQTPNPTPKTPVIIHITADSWTGNDIKNIVSESYMS